MNDVIKDLLWKIKNDGLDYALTAYSDWKEIEPVNPVLYNHIVVYRGAEHNLSSYLKKRYPEIEE